jgi:[NiFe] hydrogenase diaphorase moiety small subunit
MSNNNLNNTFFIDGKEIEFTPGQTIIQAASAVGVYIPHLCYQPKLSAHGSCRLCMVKVNGRFVSACTTTVQTKMLIENNNVELRNLRLNLIEMLFAEGNHFCPSCELSGNCQLQALAYELDMTHSDFPLQYPARKRDGSHPDIYLDRDRCINCEICVRASHELDNKNVFSLAGRGIETTLQINSDDERLSSTELLASDYSARLCPVGAIVHKQGNYMERSNERLYDQTSIEQLGNQRPSVVNAGIAGDND